MIAVLVNDGVERRDAELLALQRALRARADGLVPDAAPRFDPAPLRLLRRALSG